MRIDNPIRSAGLAYFGVILLWVFWLVCTSSTYIGFGGDQIGLLADLKIFNPSIAFGELRLLDFGWKYLMWAFNFSDRNIIFMNIMVPIFVNTISALIAMRFWIERTQPHPGLAFLATVLVVAEPLTLSLTLSGHFFWLPHLSFLVATRTFNRPLWVVCSAAVALGVLNPYLTIIYFIFVVGFVVGTHDQSRNKVLLFVLCLIIIKLGFNYLAPDFTSWLFNRDFGSPDRAQVSGIFPGNFFMPGIGTLAGYFSQEFKNNYFIYLNVLESNYSLLGLLSFFFIASYSIKVVAYLGAFSFIYALFLFPPETKFFPGLIFPSLLLDILVPEMNIFSRLTYGLYISLVLLLLVNAESVSFKQVSSRIRMFLAWIFVFVFVVPVNPPRGSLELAMISVPECAIEPNQAPRASFDYWSSYYTRYYGRQILVKPILAKSGQLLFCLRND
ncbi:hypothetical protein N9L52_07685 [Litoricolaceae bacterium]|nr:hypothetical protein [Litorivicinaceae bacterium]